MNKFTEFVQNLENVPFNINSRLLNRSNILENISLQKTISRYPINSKLNKDLLFEYLNNERIINKINSCSIYVIIYNSQENELKQTICVAYYPHHDSLMKVKILIDIPTYFLESILKNK